VELGAHKASGFFASVTAAQLAKKAMHGEARLQSGARGVVQGVTVRRQAGVGELWRPPSELLVSPSELLASPSEMLASPSEMLAPRGPRDTGAA
jgi:hypothetical protein